MNAILSPPSGRSSATATVLLAAAFALLSACTTSQLPPISLAGESFEPAKDEARLWEESREEEDQLRQQAEIYEDPELDGYLHEIVRRLTPPRMAANRVVDYQVGVIAEPSLNAFAYPHGSLYVHTGLLARMNSEDELATVLGHEMTHVEHRHMLRYRRSARNKRIGWTVATLAAEIILWEEAYDQYGEGDWLEGDLIGVLGSVLVEWGMEVAFLASVNGYGRQLELEADHGGFDKLASAGYQPAAAAAVYTTLLESSDDPGRLEGFFFGSHPKLTARLENANAWLEDGAPEGDRNTDAIDRAGEREAADREAEFRRRLLPVVRDDAWHHLETGQLELAREMVAKALDWAPEDAETRRLFSALHLALADAASEDERGEHYRAAEAALREAIRLDPDLAAAHADLGLLLYELEERAGACTSLRHYLELEPGDDYDVAEYLDELESAGDC